MSRNSGVTDLFVETAELLSFGQASAGTKSENFPWGTTYKRKKKLGAHILKKGINFS